MSTELPSSLSELKKLHAKITQEIQKREQKSRAEVLRQVESMVRDAGLSVADLLDPNAPVSEMKLPRAPAKKRGPVKPKYQNPNNLSQTWSGRGRQPDWVVAHLRTGRALEALLIDKG